MRATPLDIYIKTWRLALFKHLHTSPWSDPAGVCKNSTGPSSSDIARLKAVHTLTSTATVTFQVQVLGKYCSPWAGPHLSNKDYIKAGILQHWQWTGTGQLSRAETPDSKVQRTHTKTFKMFICRTDYRQNVFFPWTVREWYNLP